MYKIDINLVSHIKHTLENEIKIPIYLKIEEAIKSAITIGILHEGDYIANERELSSLLDVSRVTLRTAFNNLFDDGIIVRKRGIGTFVSNEQNLSSIYAPSFSQKLIMKGKRPDTLWISKSVIKASKEVASMLSIAENADVCFLKRIRYVDNAAVSYEESYIPMDLVSDLDEIHTSIFDFFRKKNIKPAKTKALVSTSFVTQEFLDIIKETNVSFPMLIIKQTTFSFAGRAIEYSVNYCRGDMYVFEI